MVEQRSLTLPRSLTRVLNQSPDGMTVVSAAADETLRFWEIMGTPNGDKKKIMGGEGSMLPSLNMATLPRSSGVFNGIR